MIQMTPSEFKRNIDNCLKRTINEEERFAITKYRKPLAWLVPPEKKKNSKNPKDILEFQKAILAVPLDPGSEIAREDLYHKALNPTRFKRLGSEIKKKLDSAMNGLIRRKEFSRLRNKIVKKKG